MRVISEVIKSVYLRLSVVSCVISFSMISNAVSAAGTCVQQHESAVSCSHELSNDVIETLKIDAGFGWGIFSGSIYNGSDQYTITQLNISMEPIHDHHHMEMMGDMHDMVHEVKVHEVKMNLQPLTKSAISMALPDEDVHIHDFNWKVIKVFGYAEQ